MAKMNFLNFKYCLAGNLLHRLVYHKFYICFQFLYSILGIFILRIFVLPIFKATCGQRKYAVIQLGWKNNAKIIFFWDTVLPHYSRFQYMWYSNLTERIQPELGRKTCVKKLPKSRNPEVIKKQMSCDVIVGQTIKI